jgi:hypothetical protein
MLIDLEMRLKRFYRFALAPELSFDVDGYDDLYE